MSVYESRPADLPSHLFAVLVDSVIFWTVAVVLFISDSGPGLALIPVPILFLAYWTLHSFGSTPGSFLAGFRFKKRAGTRPGPAYGLGLTFIRVVAAPAMIIVAALAQGMRLPDLEGYPIITERTRRRTFLSAADQYWERYRQRWGR